MDSPNPKANFAQQEAIRTIRQACRAGYDSILYGLIREGGPEVRQAIRSAGPQLVVDICKDPHYPEGARLLRVLAQSCLVDLNQRDEQSLTGLMHCAITGQVDKAQILVANRASIYITNDHDDSAVDIAAGMGGLATNMDPSQQKAMLKVLKAPEIKAVQEAADYARKAINRLGVSMSVAIKPEPIVHPGDDYATHTLNIGDALMIPVYREEEPVSILGRQPRMEKCHWEVGYEYVERNYPEGPDFVAYKKITTEDSFREAVNQAISTHVKLILDNEAYDDSMVKAYKEGRGRDYQKDDGVAFNPF